MKALRQEISNERPLLILLCFVGISAPSVTKATFVIFCHLVEQGSLYKIFVKVVNSQAL